MLQTANTNNRGVGHYTHNIDIMEKLSFLIQIQTGFIRNGQIGQTMLNLSGQIFSKSRLLEYFNNLLW